MTKCEFECANCGLPQYSCFCPQECQKCGVTVFLEDGKEWPEGPLFCWECAHERIRESTCAYDRIVEIARIIIDSVDSV